jgi:L-alanine-DL-glutamate epimerase-like enolase superfamily enzyme
VWGLTELLHIAALASAYDIPVIPHVGGTRDGSHFIMATTNAPWAEMFMPPPGGPKSVYEQWAQQNGVSRGEEGIYMRPPEDPGRNRTALHTSDAAYFRHLSRSEI